VTEDDAIPDPPTSPEEPLPEPEARGAERAPHPARSRLVRKNREMRAQRTRLRVALGATIGVSLLACALLALWGLGQTRRAAELEGQVAQARAALVEAGEDFAAVEREREILVQGRIPGLRPLEFDSVLPIGEGPVRNVSFNLTRTRQEPVYEYRLVVHNDGDEPIEPWVSVALFDRLGVQIGRARVGFENPLDADGRRSLMPGEIRAYSGKVQVEGDAPPAYFRIVSD
jgi:hypothetical protein